MIMTTKMMVPEQQMIMVMVMMKLLSGKTRIHCEW